MVAARVIKRSLGPDGNLVGSFNHNKMLDTRIYDIMFMYGTVQQICQQNRFEHVQTCRFRRIQNQNIRSGSETQEYRLSNREV